MKKTRKRTKPISAEQIARMATRGKDISRFFTGGLMRNPIRRVNVDFTTEMLRELDKEAAGLNISRQAVIKTLVREGLDRRFQGRKTAARESSKGIRVAFRSRGTSAK
jgi:hypothetical protein